MDKIIRVDLSATDGVVEKCFYQQSAVEKVDFMKIISNTSFKDDADAIYDKLCRIRKAKDIQSEEDEEDKYDTNEDINLAKCLLLFKTAGDNNIRIEGKGGSIKAELPSIYNELLEERLKNIYITHKLNYSPMTFEEGKNILENNLCEDVVDFLNEYLTIEERAKGNKIIIEDFMVEEYISLSESPKEVTPEQIKAKIKELEECNRKGSGRKVKILRLCAVKLLMQMRGFSSCNKVYREMHQILRFMGLIDKDEQSDCKQIRENINDYDYRIEDTFKRYCERYKGYEVIYEVDGSEIDF